MGKLIDWRSFVYGVFFTLCFYQATNMLDYTSKMNFKPEIAAKIAALEKSLTRDFKTRLDTEIKQLRQVAAAKHVQVAAAKHVAVPSTSSDQICKQLSACTPFCRICTSKCVTLSKTEQNALNDLLCSSIFGGNKLTPKVVENTPAQQPVQASAATANAPEQVPTQVSAATTSGQVGVGIGLGVADSVAAAGTGAGGNGGGGKVETPKASSQTSGNNCKQMHVQYGVQPGVAWGSLPSLLQKEWETLNCDSLFGVTKPKAVSGSGTCESLAREYAPQIGSSWGLLPKPKRST